MVFLPVSHLRTRSGVASHFSAIAARAVDILGMLGAATRVARAVEAHRDPRDADLRKLGITSRLPKVW